MRVFALFLCHARVCLYIYIYIYIYIHIHTHTHTHTHIYIYIYIYIYISVYSDVNVYADDAHDRCIYNKCIQSTNLITSNLSFHAAMGRQSVETDFGSDDVQIQ